MRNPRYLAVLPLILGQAVLFGQWILLPCTVIVSLAFVAMLLRLARHHLNVVRKGNLSPV